MNDPRGVYCRTGEHERCSLVCACDCHREPRPVGAWGEWSNTFGDRDVHLIEVPTGLLRLVEERAS